MKRKRRAQLAVLTLVIVVAEPCSEAYLLPWAQASVELCDKPFLPLCWFSVATWPGANCLF